MPRQFQWDKLAQELADDVHPETKGDGSRVAVIDTGVNWQYDLVFSTVFSTNDAGEITEAGYGWKAGTSMAAPQVTGAVALVRSLRPDATVTEVESLISDSADDLGQTFHGAGHLNLTALIEAVGE